MSYKQTLSYYKLKILDLIVVLKFNQRRMMESQIKGILLRVLVLFSINLFSMVQSVDLIQEPLGSVQSGMVVLHQSTSAIPAGIQTSYTITYSGNRTRAPTPFYFLNRYKMQDKFIYENFYSYVKSADTDHWQLAVEPISATNVLVFSISYIAVQDLYGNFFVKQYTYGTQTGLTSGSGSRSYTATYNFSQQFMNSTLSSNFSQNKIAVSWVGFYHSTPRDVEIYIHAYFMNSSYFSIVMSTTVNDYWYRLNVMTCIVDLDRFPTSVKFLTDTVVLSVSNTVKSWTEFDGFANVSYCFGYSGIKASTPNSLDIYWEQLNITAIQVHLSLLTFARYSYIFIWNQTIIAAPVDPVAPPVDPVDPIAPIDPIDPLPDTTPTPSLVIPTQIQQQDSSSSVGIIVGILITVLFIGGIVSLLVYRYKFRKGTRVPIPQNQKEFHIFTPSFL